IVRLDGTGISHVAEPRRWFEGPTPWQQRLLWCDDAQQAATNWYVVRDDTDVGRSFLAGFDEASKLCVGYIGREGFRASPPPPADQFAVGPERFNLNYTSRLAGLRVSGRYRGRGRGPLLPWNLYVIDENRLTEIDLRARSVRKLFESSDLVGVQIAVMALP